MSAEDNFTPGDRVSYHALSGKNMIGTVIEYWPTDKKFDRENYVRIELDDPVKRADYGATLFSKSRAEPYDEDAEPDPREMRDALMDLRDRIQSGHCLDVDKIPGVYDALSYAIGRAEDSF